MLKLHLLLAGDATSIRYLAGKMPAMMAVLVQRFATLLQCVSL